MPRSRYKAQERRSGVGRTAIYEFQFRSIQNAVEDKLCVTWYRSRIRKENGTEIKQFQTAVMCREVHITPNYLIIHVGVCEARSESPYATSIS